MLLSFFAGRRSAQISLNWNVVARVNDHPFYRADLEARLKLFETRALEIMCYEYLVEQEARRRNIPLPKASNVVNLDGTGVRLQEILSQIALQDITDDYYRRIYDEFAEQLATFDIETAWLISENSLQAFREGLASHLDFQSLRQKYAVSLPADLDTRELTLQQCLELFGPVARSQISKLTDGQISQPIAFQDGFLIVQLKHARKSYQELLPRIKSQVIESRKQHLLNTIFGRAIIISNIYTPKLYRNPVLMEQLEPTTYLASPTTGKPQPVRSLPLMDSKSPAAPGLPKPSPVEKPSP